MMARLSRTLALATLLLGGVTCAPQLTQVVLVIDTNMVVPAEIDAIRVVVQSGTGTPLDTTIDLTAAGHPSLPLTLTVVPGADAGATFQVTVTGTGTSSGFVVTRTVQFGFVNQTSKSVPIALVRGCEGVQCPPGSTETCTETGCRTPALLRDTLPPFPSCEIYTQDCNQNPADGCETDVRVSPSNCGRCGHACGTSAACVDGVCDNDRVVALTAGRAHACALRTNGQVECWGDNGMAQLGPATTASSSRAVVVSGLVGVAQIAAGDDFTCARRTAGTIACWGSNSSLQLGTTGASGVTSVALPAHVTALEIATGGNFACALGSDQRVYCWGANDRLQLGTMASSPSGVMGPVLTAGTMGPPLQSVVAIAAGGAHACAVATAPGIGVFCWGDGSMGQLGGGTSAAPSFATAVTLPVSLATPVDSNTLAAGGSRSCVVSNANEVLCWGVLVNGASPIAPTRLVAADSMTPVHAIAVAAGGSHTCGLHRIDATHIEAWCMGSNDFGQLGRGATGMPAMQTSPILGPTDLLALAAGSDFACAARRYGGVVCWGNNASFQGGDSSGGALLTPDPVASLP